MDGRWLDRTRGWFVIVAGAALVASCGADEDDPYLVVRGSPAALDADYLYYLKNDSREPHDLISYRKTTGEQRMLGNFDGGGGELAVADGFVVTNTRDATVRLPVGGGAPETLRAPSCRMIQVVDHTVYCVADSRSATSAEVLISFALAGGPERVVIPERTVDYVVDRGVVFWSSAAGRLARTDLAAGTTADLARANIISAIAVDEMDVYFTDIDTPTGIRRLLRIPRGGGAAAMLGEIARVQTALAVDERHVYWSELGVFALRKDGTAPPFRLGSSREVARGTTGPPRAVLLDRVHVYWWAARINRVEKPQ